MEFIELKSEAERNLLWMALDLPRVARCCGCGADVDFRKASLLPVFESYPVKTNDHAVVLCDNILCMSEWLTYTEDERNKEVLYGFR